MPKTEKPNLMDSNFEPSYEQLQEIGVTMMIGVRERALKASLRMKELMIKELSNDSRESTSDKEDVRNSMSCTS